MIIPKGLKIIHEAIEKATKEWQVGGGGHLPG